MQCPMRSAVKCTPARAVLTPEPAKDVIAAGSAPSTGVLVSGLPVPGSGPAFSLSTRRSGHADRSGRNTFGRSAHNRERVPVLCATRILAPNRDDLWGEVHSWLPSAPIVLHALASGKVTWQSDNSVKPVLKRASTGFTRGRASTAATAFTRFARWHIVQPPQPLQPPAPTSAPTSAYLSTYLSTYLLSTYLCRP